MMSLISDANLPLNLLDTEAFKKYTEFIWTSSTLKAEDLKKIPSSSKTIKNKMKAARDKNLAEFKESASALAARGKIAISFDHHHATNTGDLSNDALGFGVTITDSVSKLFLLQSALSRPALELFRHDRTKLTPPWCFSSSVLSN